MVVVLSCVSANKQRIYVCVDVCVRTCGRERKEGLVCTLHINTYINTQKHTYHINKCIHIHGYIQIHIHNDLLTHK